MPQSKRIASACLMLVLATMSLGVLLHGETSAQDQEDRPVDQAAWGKPVDGLACRLRMQSRYVVGQAITAVLEVKNTSNKKRYIVPRFDPVYCDHLEFEVTGPKGKLELFHALRGVASAKDYEAIEPGEVKRFDVADLAQHFVALNGRLSYLWPERHRMPTGKYTARFRFYSPKILPQIVSWTSNKGFKVVPNKGFPEELLVQQWAEEAESPAVAFELVPVSGDDLVVHEWGVFSVFNDVKYANGNRKEEWGALPSFFYRQFPKERLCWVPGAWDKPIVYFYAKPTPIQVSFKVTFAEGAPVVWWPAAAVPIQDWPGARSASDPWPHRSLTWHAWLGERFPADFRNWFPFAQQKFPDKVADFPLPKGCWLEDASLPGATQIAVIGNIEGEPKMYFSGARDRIETSRFLYYDGLVPAPDYLRCEKIDAGAIVLRNRARFDMGPLFLVDRRGKDHVGFAAVGSLRAGDPTKITPTKIAAGDWPDAGLRAVRKSLLDAGLFEPEADSLLKIWRRRFFEADGVTAFHLLPQAEYDRMLPVEIRPAVKPLRVGIALHTHLEIEPELTERIGALIRQLDSSSFPMRTAADKTLSELGPLAIAMLRAELKKGPPLEVTRRIQAILDRVDAATWLDLPVPAKK